ncbi:MAG: exodeoxyribonuclease VII large subunit [Gammaproteobacteria bacterium]|nr:exodeoxyribonuclease VII large subunit [Gammaproteobacteria bacterium]
MSRDRKTTLTKGDPGVSTLARRDVYSVTRLNEAARALIEDEFGTIWVEGEITNLARPSSGHIYFSLKDEGAQLRCAMFRSRNNLLGFEPKDGLQVLALGRVSLYTARGSFQLIVEALEPAGEGLLRLKFEELKRKLNDEGLFDPDLKQALPYWPRAIGVVTSITGAALHDILNVLNRRCPSISVIIYPTSVQGDGAAAEIAAAIGNASRREECDVLIIGRGGGSLEDLWSFNEEIVARAIYASPIPIVSAVGHEIDFTIADFVADVRAATPSAAAELVSPDALEVNAKIMNFRQRLGATVTFTLKTHAHELNQLSQRLVSPRRRLEMHFQRLDELLQRLPVDVSNQLKLHRARFDALLSRANMGSPRARISLLRRDISHLHQRLDAALRRSLRDQWQTLKRFESLLAALGPSATLERGYAIVTDESGRIVTDANDLKRRQEVTTRVARGRFKSAVIMIEAEEKDSKGSVS